MRLCFIPLILFRLSSALFRYALLYSLCVGSDLIIDFESQGQGGAAGFGRNAGLGAAADGGEKVFELET
jgi:hypothetical protein